MCCLTVACCTICFFLSSPTKFPMNGCEREEVYLRLPRHEPCFVAILFLLYCILIWERSTTQCDVKSFYYSLQLSHEIFSFKHWSRIQPSQITASSTINYSTRSNSQNKRIKSAPHKIYAPSSVSSNQNMPQGIYNVLSANRREVRSMSSGNPVSSGSNIISPFAHVRKRSASKNRHEECATFLSCTQHLTKVG